MQAFYTPKIAGHIFLFWIKSLWVACPVETIQADGFQHLGTPKGFAFKFHIQVPNRCFHSLWPSQIRSLRFLEIFKPPTHLLPNLHNQHWRRHSLFHPNEAHASAESTREMRSKSVPVFIIYTLKKSEKGRWHQDLSNWITMNHIFPILFSYPLAYIYKQICSPNCVVILRSMAWTTWWPVDVHLWPVEVVKERFLLSWRTWFLDFAPVPMQHLVFFSRRFSTQHVKTSCIPPCAQTNRRNQLTLRDNLWRTCLDCIQKVILTRTPPDLFCFLVLDLSTSP